MCGSSKIFLMPPMSFGVQTRVTRNVPLPRNKTLLTLPIISSDFRASVPPDLVWELPGVWRGKCPRDVFNEIVGSAGPAAQGWPVPFLP